MLKPVNKHVLIEPLKHDTFVAQARETYEEIGTVIDYAADLIKVRGLTAEAPVVRGMKVYFDSWQASKFPKEDGEGYYWLVPFDSIKAYEQIPKE